MELTEIEKIKRDNGFDAYLLAKEYVYHDYEAFKDEVFVFRKALKKVNDLAQLLDLDITAHNKEKLEKKTEMAKEAANLAGYAQVRLKKIGKTKEAAQLHISKNDYIRTSDVEAKTRALATLGILQSAISDLNPKYVKDADLIVLQNKIDIFSKTEGDSTMIHKETPEERKNFKKALRETGTAIVDILTLARKFEDTNAEFYKGLVAQSVVQKAHGHHTILSLTIHSKANNQPISNAIASLSKSKKIGISGSDGILSIEKVINGTTTLSVKAAGHEDYVEEIHLLSGQNNHFDIVM